MQVNELPHAIRQFVASTTARAKELRVAPPRPTWQSASRVLWLALLATILIAGWYWGGTVMAGLQGKPLGEAGNEEVVLHVACTAPACLQHDVIRLAKSTVRFPLACSACRQPLAERARRRADCGHWVAVAAVEAGSPCSVCARLSAGKPMSAPAATRPANPDDEEDGW